jgi:hypothetical protein
LEFSRWILVYLHDELNECASEEPPFVSAASRSGGEACRVSELSGAVLGAAQMSEQNLNICRSMNLTPHPNL